MVQEQNRQNQSNDDLEGHQDLQNPKAIVNRGPQIDGGFTKIEKPSNAHGSLTPNSFNVIEKGHDN